MTLTAIGAVSDVK